MPIQDLTNQKFGSLTAKRKTEQRASNGSVIWECQCDCGAIHFYSAKDLKRKKSNFCSICNKKREIGNKYGRLLVLEPAESDSPGQFWICRCDCGNITTVSTSSLHAGATQSCGCLQKEKAQLNFNDLTGKIFGRWQVLEKTDQRNLSKQIMWKCQCSCQNQTIRLVAGAELSTGRSLSCGCLRQSHGELKIIEILQKNNISFETEKTFPDCTFPDTGCWARFDFYVEDKYLIEFDGIQHFFPTRGETELKTVQKRDKAKNNWCKEKNIPLIRIPYTILSTLKLEDLRLETTNYLV